MVVAVKSTEISEIIFREQVQGKEMSWLSKYEEKRLLKNFGMQNMKGTRHIRVRRRMDMKPINAEAFLLAGCGSRYTQRKS